MKRLSEVARIVGVTRRTLQEYCKIGLLCPSEKTEGGYWQYDDDAIDKLKTIQVFIEVGYERKKIKTLLENPNLDLSGELDQVIVKLEEKRKRLEGMINYIKIIKLSEQFPEHVKHMLYEIDQTTCFHGKSFTQQLNDSIDLISDMEDVDSEEMKLRIPVGTLLYLLSQLQGEETTSTKVQNYVSIFIRDFAQVLLHEEPLDDDITEGEVNEILLEGLIEYLNDPEGSEAIDKLMGTGTTNFLIRAFSAHLEATELLSKEAKEGEQ